MYNWGVVSTVRARPLYIYIYRTFVAPGPPCGPLWLHFAITVNRAFPCILRLRSTAELIEESVCLFAMDSTRREAALARRRERERARRANETAEERETLLARRRVRDRRANETSPSPNCSKYNSNVQKLCSPTMYKNCVPVCIENCVLQCLVRMPLTLAPRMCVHRSSIYVRAYSM